VILSLAGHEIRSVAIDNHSKDKVSLPAVIYRMEMLLLPMPSEPNTTPSNAGNNLWLLQKRTPHLL